MSAADPQIARPVGLMEILAPLAAIWLGMPVWVWLVFIAFILALLVLDLGVFHREAHVVKFEESLRMAAFYVSMAVLFGVAVWWIYYTNPPENSLDRAILAATSDSDRAWTALQLYYTGYVVEYTLAMDNVFVISLVFTYFAVPREYQHRVLFWGIIGVIVLRGIMIGVGAALIAQWSWILYFFAAFLIFTGIKMLMPAKEESTDMGGNVVIRLMRRNLRVTPGFHGERFFVRLPDPKTGKIVTWVTPLFLALMTVEFVDVVFAVDSVPAIFAITQEPFIVYTSNIFAIVGLRTLYFTLSAMVHRFHYLKYALALVLVFIGLKIVLGDFFPGGKVPPELSLTVTLGLIAGGIVYSLWKTRNEPPAKAAGH